jgi:hypothetical protein
LENIVGFSFQRSYTRGGYTLQWKIDEFFPGGEGEAAMKIGFRTPSLKKRISVRTSIKRQAVHRAGLKMPRGYGWARDPKKYAYNKVYQRTSFDVFSILKKLFKGSK